MGFLSPYKKTERIDFGDNFYAVAKVFLTTKEENEAQKAMMQVGVKYAKDGSTPDISTNLDQGAYLIELASQSLVEWNLTDENDVLLPFGNIDQKRASMALLPKEAVQKIVAVYQDGPRKDPDAKFPDADSSSDTQGESGTAGTG